MKRSMIIAFLVTMMIFGSAMLFGCDDDDGAPSCSSLCSKIRECPDADDEIDEQINECLEQCADMKASLQSGVFEQIAECAERTMCDDVDTEDACFAPAFASCKANSTSTTFVDVLCAKMVECEAEYMTDIDTCKSIITATPAVYCLKTSVYEQTTACLSNATCETAESCVEGLGMFDDDISGDSSYDGETM